MFTDMIRIKPNYSLRPHPLQLQFQTIYRPVMAQNLEKRQSCLSKGFIEVKSFL